MPHPEEREESTGTGELPPEYGGEMVHNINLPEGGQETGSVADEGEIIDLGENPLYNETNPIFQFRSAALGLEVDQMKILLYVIGGYFLYTRFIK